MTFAVMSLKSSQPAPLSLWRRDCPPAPPSEALVAAVLAFGDLRRVREDGCTVISFSPERASSEDMRMLLREDSARALDVSVVWSETDPCRRSKGRWAKGDVPRQGQG
jgi:hypothetical protein